MNLLPSANVAASFNNWIGKMYLDPIYCRVVSIRNDDPDGASVIATVHVYSRDTDMSGDLSNARYKAREIAYKRMDLAKILAIPDIVDHATSPVTAATLTAYLKKLGFDIEVEDIQVTGVSPYVVTATETSPFYYGTKTIRRMADILL